MIIDKLLYLLAHYLHYSNVFYYTCLEISCNEYSFTLLLCTDIDFSLIFVVVVIVIYNQS